MFVRVSVEEVISSLLSEEIDRDKICFKWASMCLTIAPVFI